MYKNLKKMLHTYIEEHAQEAVQLIWDISAIPSPTGHTEKKAAWVLQYLQHIGIDNAYIDEVGNVLYPCQLAEGQKCPLYNAHIDTVFSQLDEIQPRIDGNILAAPSCGDNSASVAALLFFIRFIHDRHITLPTGILFAFNVGEEGLGNLQGIRHIMKQWKDRISEVIAVDGTSEMAVNLAVGSLRYAITVEAEGGHSWSHFGNDNAIAIAASLIQRIYALTAPTSPRTTYNVGTITGGTTVNSIAERATFTLDLRSESMSSLTAIDSAVKELIKAAMTNKISITQELLGERPCSDGILQSALYDRYEAVRTELGLPIIWKSSSTDANIPLHLGIPAISFGVYRGYRAHTIHENLEIDSIPQGLLQLGLYMLHDID